MKKLFTLLFALVASTALWAHDFLAGGIYYNILTDKTNEVAVTYRGSDYDSYDNEYFGSVTIPSSVTYNGTTYSVTTIGSYAFRNCSGLTSITIPNSVTSIGGRAFYECSSLTSPVYNAHCFAYLPISYQGAYTIPEGIKQIAGGAFYECTGLTTITIPNSVTTIGSYAFYRCYGLTSITIPNSVTSIGYQAFYDCFRLTSPVYNAHCFAYLPISYQGAYTIPEGIKQIAGCAFYECTGLTTITIPNSVTSIGDRAFIRCESLKSVTIGNSVTNIGEYAFYNCYSLTSVAIPNSVTSIGDFAFHDCSSLTSPVYNAHCFAYMPTSYSGAYTIPKGIEQIAGGAFEECTGLTSITIPNSVTSIGDYAFRYCSGLTSITIPNSVTSIGWWAFAFCKGLTSITIPNSVTTIEFYAFYDCSSLSSVAIGNGVTKIGNSEFAGCTGLNLLRLGTGIQNIDDNAFANCTKLYDIYCLAAEPPTGYTSSFANYNAFLHVPCESQRLYMLDILFGEFKYIECIASDEVTTDDIVITPGSTDVTITWPTEEGADTYTIVIKKDGEVFCTLTFNAEGQLLNIAFAPGRQGNHPAQYAEQANNGYRFTVTGLEEATDYTYTITTKDASNKTISEHSGEFTTNSATALDNTHSQSTNCQKLIRDGQLLIIRDGKTYNAQGVELK